MVYLFFETVETNEICKLLVSEGEVNNGEYIGEYSSCGIFTNIC